MEFQKQVNWIIAQLKNRRHDAWAERIQECIDAGATGGEILMCLRHELKNLKNEGIITDKTLLHRINQITGTDPLQ